MRSPLEAARWLATRLEEDALDYALGGALALNAWTAPRQTFDVDLMVFVDDRELGRVLDALERAGALFDRRAAEQSVAAAGLLIATFGGLRVDVFLAVHPVHVEMGRRRRSITVDGQALWFLSPEDVALLKLFYARPKDLVDLERLFAAQPTLDRAYIGSWLARIVPAGDRRLAILADLAARFGG